ncbi:hypothetical protein ATY27_09530 [Rheinheimera sp. F8]|nr:hypothetical protein ATY27_09530 [Rheinheimera sp. F8]
MDGTRKTQEQFSGLATDGRYTENAGAVFRAGLPFDSVQTSFIRGLEQQIHYLLSLACGDILHSSTIICGKSSRQPAFPKPISPIFSRLAIVNPPTPDKFIFLFKY